AQPAAADLGLGRDGPRQAVGSFLARSPPPLPPRNGTPATNRPDTRTPRTAVAVRASRPRAAPLLPTIRRWRAGPLRWARGRRCRWACPCRRPDAGGPSLVRGCTPSSCAPAEKILRIRDGVPGRNTPGRVTAQPGGQQKGAVPFLPCGFAYLTY